ncbi:MAG: NAD(P)H-dependent glycerol-3-phosphate dehydrogenase [Christensenellaceae bacterium]
MKVSVLGCGRWGSFLGWYLSRINNDVYLYGNADSKAYLSLKENGKNDYLTLPDKIELGCDLEYAVKRAEIIVISISSQSLRSFLTKVARLDIADKKFILCMKGIECDTGKRLTEVAKECGIDGNNLAVWVGPGHIQEFLLEKPNCMVIDSENQELVRFLADSFKSELIRFYYGEDLIGSEIGAAAKNVMGIAAGMLDGGGYKTLKGPLMARGAREVARLIKAMGGNEMSAFGLCHLGDYETTLFSEFSNNRRFGEAYVKGESFSKLAEGVMTAKAMKKLAGQYNVDLPITDCIYNILFEKKNWNDELLQLFKRTPRTEFYK